MISIISLKKRGGGIIKTPTKFLLVKGITGKWSFPKGQIELNETLADCAKREIYEETGLIIDNIQDKKLIRLFDNFYYLIEYEQEVPTKPIDTNEIFDIKWFLLEETKSIEKNRDVSVFFRKLLNKQSLI